MAAPSSDEVSERYLDLLKRALTRSLFIDEERWPVGWTGWARQKRHRKVIATAVQRALRRRQWEIVRPTPDKEKRLVGLDWPLHAETMVGDRRLENVQRCVRQVIADAVPGDLLEAGVWRGGVTIFMRAALDAYRDADRKVWVVDSFRGLPPPDPDRYPADAGSDFWEQTAFAVGLDEVKRNFEHYGLLDERVCFLEGWFEDTLPSAPIDALAVLRLDSDMYSSTMTAMTHLYPKLSPGGFVIIDDYALEPCRRAVTDYRVQHGIAEPIQPVLPGERPLEEYAVWWRRAPG